MKQASLGRAGDTTFSGEGWPVILAHLQGAPWRVSVGLLVWVLWRHFPLHSGGLLTQISLFTLTKLILSKAGKAMGNAREYECNSRMVCCGFGKTEAGNAEKEPRQRTPEQLYNLPSWRPWISHPSPGPVLLSKAMTQKVWGGTDFSIFIRKCYKVEK